MSTPTEPAGPVPELHLRVGVSELRRRPGNRRHVGRDLALEGLSVTTAAVVPGGEGRLDLVLESLSDGITATGTVTFDWAGACRRCLEPTGGTIVVPVREVFGDHPVSPDVSATEGDSVDLGPVVRDAVVLALPLAPLCRDDCPGPDPEHFPVTVEGDDGPPPADPRWAALSDLRFDPDDGER